MRIFALATVVVAACIYSALAALWINRYREYREESEIVPRSVVVWIVMCLFASVSYATIAVLCYGGVL